MTNREWLLNKMQNMSDEEFGEMIECHKITEIECTSEGCTNCKVNWLREECKIKLSKTERIILENIDKEYTWIARDNDNALFIYKGKPFRRFRDKWNSDEDATELTVFNHLFQFITWNDEQPHSIEELLKGE